MASAEAWWAGEAASAAPRVRLGPQDWQRLVDGWMAPQPIPDFDLVDHQGRPFGLGELRDGYVLVGFIFTHCSVPTACALTTSKMHEVGKLWEARGERDRKLYLLTLTIDPENDTPEALASYSELVRRDVPSWRFATGPAGLMEKGLPSLFGVFVDETADGEIAHSVKVALLEPGLRIARVWKNNRFEPEEVIEMVVGGR